ncbi:MAG: putative Lysophospholipid acyltransferase LPEAT1 [Streblomastix strix]|uniref:Putative Lysophospholipid acyltransferase LPEAT1 n=1 Tax=Streblomastix strix TaxID=222440 RepID=A0A5J4WCQ1_9EUKA|nr:MAG: putative Lysophospholipid acyltransferase LPEAT1 [Streblomastix strix]
MTHLQQDDIPSGTTGRYSLFESLEASSDEIDICGLKIKTNAVDAFEVPRFSFLGSVKFALGFIFLLPIRAVLMIAQCLIITIIYILVYPLIGPIDKPQNLFIRFLARSVGYIWARLNMLILGFIYVREHGHPHRDAKLLVAGPHTSSIDMFYFIYKFGPSFAVGEFVSKAPFIGQLSRVYNNLVIDRKATGNSTQFLENLKKRISEEDESGRSFPKVVIFPEGATGNGRSLNYFHSGAFVPGEPLQPIIIKYPYISNCTAWSVRSWVSHFIIVMSQLTNWIDVTYLPLYVPSAVERDHPRLLAYNVKIAMSLQGELARTELTYADRKEYEKQRKAALKCGYRMPQPRQRSLQYQNQREPLIPVDPGAIDIGPSWFFEGASDHVFYSSQPLPPYEILYQLEYGKHSNASASENQHLRSGNEGSEFV